MQGGGREWTLPGLGLRGVPVEVAGILATRGPCCLSRVAPCTPPGGLLGLVRTY